MESFLDRCCNSSLVKQPILKEVGRVTELWEDLLKIIIEGEVERLNLVLTSLLTCTGNAVFRPNFYTKVTCLEVKDVLGKRINDVADQIESTSSAFSKLLRKVRNLINSENTWKINIFIDAGMYENIQLDDARISRVWDEEGWPLLNVRLNFLAVNLTNRKILYRFTVLIIAMIRKGLKQHSRDFLDTLSKHSVHRDFEKNDPFQLPPYLLLEYMQIYLICCYMYKIDPQCLKLINGKVFVFLIKSLWEHSVKESASRNSISIKNFEEWQFAEKACFHFADRILVEELKDVEGECIKDDWIELCNKDGDKSTQFLDLISASLAQDFANLQVLMFDGPNSKIKELSMKITVKCVELAKSCKDCPKLCKELLLTSFSFWPSPVLFDLLFPGKQIEEEEKNVSTRLFEDLRSLQSVKFSSVLSSTFVCQCKLNVLHNNQHLLNILETMQYKSFYAWENDEILIECCTNLLKQCRPDLLISKCGTKDCFEEKYIKVKTSVVEKFKARKRLQKDLRKPSTKAEVNKVVRVGEVLRKEEEAELRKVDLELKKAKVLKVEEERNERPHRFLSLVENEPSLSSSSIVVEIPNTKLATEGVDLHESAETTECFRSPLPKIARLDEFTQEEPTPNAVVVSENAVMLPPPEKRVLRPSRKLQKVVEESGPHGCSNEVEKSGKDHDDDDKEFRDLTIEDFGPGRRYPAPLKSKRRKDFWWFTNTGLEIVPPRCNSYVEINPNPINSQEDHVVVRKYIKHSDGNILRCHYCYDTFDHLNRYREHLAIHLGAQMFRCEICLRRFLQLRGKSNHKCVGTKLTFKCFRSDHQMPYQTHRSDTFRRHMLTMHGLVWSAANQHHKRIQHDGDQPENNLQNED